MVNKVLKDNWQPELNKSKIEVVDFTTKCPRNHYKGRLWLILETPITFETR